MWRTGEFDRADVDNGLVGATDGAGNEIYKRPEVEQPAQEETTLPDVVETTEDISPITPTAETEKPATALSRIPKDETSGEPIYEQAETPDLAWDAIMEQTEGDEAMAQSVVNSMVAEKEAAVKQAEKAKVKGGTTIAEKIAAEREHKAAIEDAKGTLAIWQRIAEIPQRRQEASEAERLRTEKEQADALRAEQERIKAEEEIQKAEEAKWTERKKKIDKELQNAAEVYRDVPEAVEILEMTAPQDLHEAASIVLSTHKVLLGDTETGRGLANELGFSGNSQEMKSKIGLFARKEKGGKSVRELSEDYMKEVCDQYGIQYDNAEALDALLDVIHSTRTYSDIRSYITERRLKQAESVYNHHMEQLRAWEEEQFFEANHMTIEEAEAYAEMRQEEMRQLHENFDESEYYGILADEMAQRQQNEQNDQLTPQEHGRESRQNNQGENRRGNTENEQDGQNRANKVYGADNGVLSPTQPNVANRGTTDRAEAKHAETDKLSDSAQNNLRNEVSESQYKGAEYSLSDEVDENGHPFVVSGNGTTTFGEIRDESGLPAAPIKLSQGVQGENGKGYGLAHIEANHGEQIRNAGFNSVEEFVSYVAKNYDEENIRVGKRRDNGSATFLIQVTDKHDNTLFIELSKDGSYWNVNSGGVFRKGYANKKETAVKTEPQQPKNATSDGSSLSDNANGIAETEPNSEPTVSTDKGSEKTASAKTLGEKVAAAEAETNTTPTDAQKEAGNYKKGHIQVGTFNVTIENPKGSIRSGVDANGEKWETEMQNTYGYIRGTEGVDGDHIDVFLSNDIDSWNGRKVFVIDQYNPDGTFDEHKVMLGFNDIDDADSAYLSNYSAGWEKNRKIVIRPCNTEDFEKWISSSHRKTKPFAEYKSVKNVETSTVAPSCH